MLSRIAWAVCAASATRSGLLPISSKQALDFIQNRGGDLTLARLGNAAITVRGDEDDLVVGGVEADVLSGDVVVDDQVGVLVLEHPALPLEPLFAVLGAERDDELAGTLSVPQRQRDIGRRLELERPARR